jgi:hypothetical protein
LSAELLAVALSLVLLTTACVGRRSTDYTPPVTPTIPATSAARADGLTSFEIRVTDDGYSSADQVSAGRVAITLHNDGHGQRNAQFLRVNDGVSLAQLAATFQNDQRSAMSLVSFAGGPGTVPPGGTQEVVQDLVEGQYVMVTLLLGEDGFQYVPPGMFKPFRVVPASTPPTSAPLPGDEVLRLEDFGFGIPQLSAGSHTLRLDNVGKVPHEILVKRMAPETTLGDALAFVLTPVGTPPYADAGGALVFPGGQSVSMTLELAPGQYVAICYFRDSATRKTHAELGMIRDFTVD